MPRSTHTSPERTPHRFVVMDAMRGIAALIVAAFHTPTVSGRKLVPHGYLAVDFFFLLSGFVIAFAYGKKLDSGWRSWTFFKVRFARLYPMYFAGLLLSILAATFAQHRGILIAYGSPKTLIVKIFSGALLLPDPRKSQVLYPLNYPMWSILFEVISNIAHALFLRRRSNRTLLIWIGVNGVLLALAIFKQGSSDFGFTARTALFSIPRVLFAYTTGVLTERWWSSGARTVRIPALVPFALLIGMLALPAWIFTYVSPRHGIAFGDILLSLLMLPALLACSAHAFAGRLLHTPSHLLGVASYAIYILQIPVFYLLSGFCRVKNGAPYPHASIAFESLLLAGIFLLALLSEYAYDRPVRTRLRNWLHV